MRILLEPSTCSLCKWHHFDLAFLSVSDPRSSSAVLQFSESDYRAVEGGEGVSVCLILVSLTGQLIANATVGFTISGSQGRPSTQSGLVDLTQSLVGEAVFCGTLSFPGDSRVVGDQQFVLTAFALVNEPDTISFTPGGDQANITYIDNDGMLVMQLFNRVRVSLMNA